MYMDKIAVGPESRGRVSLDAPVKANLKEVAAALEKSIRDLTVVILDRPRHQQIIEECRSAGARIRLITDGDVSPAVAATYPNSGVDMLLGIGGAPEGVISAAALRCLGGDFQGRLWPEDDQEAARCLEMGITDVKRILTLDDLVKTDDVVFSSTGVTDGDLLKGVRFSGKNARTYTLVMRGATGTVRYMEAIHQLDRKPLFRDNSIRLD
jgi:fructose-1,6-bisphosphatase II